MEDRDIIGDWLSQLCIEKGPAQMLMRNRILVTVHNQNSVQELEFRLLSSSYT